MSQAICPISTCSNTTNLKIKMTNSQPSHSGNRGPNCSYCKIAIEDSHLLFADNRYWHEDCLRCHCCDCRLGEVGNSLYTKADLLLCKRDYLRMFGTTGYCAACDKVIPAFELVMRARNNVYHLECFACQQCSHRFCVGDKFYLYSNQIMCEVDYEEAIMFNHSQPMFGNPNQISNIYHYSPQNPYSIPLQTSKSAESGPGSFVKETSRSRDTVPYNALQELKQQTDNIPIQQRGADDSSSGYGSPSPTNNVQAEKY